MIYANKITILRMLVILGQLLLIWIAVELVLINGGYTIETITLKPLEYINSGESAT